MIIQLSDPWFLAVVVVLVTLIRRPWSESSLSALRHGGNGTFAIFYFVVSHEWCSYWSIYFYGLLNHALSQNIYGLWLR